MKKFVTLALALIMALSLAAPAMAFTGVEASASNSEIGLAIRLVDVSSGYVNVNFDAPPSNRGYVKNEVVCAVVSMSVPKGVDPSTKYGELVFSGKNVSLYQEENFTADINATTGTLLQHMSKNANDVLSTNSAKGTGRHFKYKSGSAIAMDNDGLAALEPTADQTYHFAVFGKVLADEATMTATLQGAYTLANDNDLVVGTAGANDTEWKTVAADDADDSVYHVRSNDLGDYYISYVNQRENAASTGTTLTSRSTLIGADEVGYYIIDKKLFDENGYGGDGNSETKNAYKALIVTDKNFVCKRMYIFAPGKTAGTLGNLPGDAYLVIESNGGSSVDGVSKDVRFYGDMTNTPTGLADATETASLLPVLKEVVKEFGLDPTISGVLKPDWWKGYEEYTVSVDIEPWYAEVTVPPEIEIEIPKTGDALSVMGFVLIALAGIAVVAVRKVKA